MPSSCVLYGTTRPLPYQKNDSNHRTYRWPGGPGGPSALSLRVEQFLLLLNCQSLLPAVALEQELEVPLGCVRTQHWMTQRPRREAKRENTEAVVTNETGRGGGKWERCTIAGALTGTPFSPSPQRRCSRRFSQGRLCRRRAPQGSALPDSFTGPLLPGDHEVVRATFDLLLQSSLPRLPQSGGHRFRQFLHKI